MVITSQMFAPFHNPDFAGRPPNARRRRITRPDAGVSDLPAPGLRERERARDGRKALAQILLSKL